MAPKAAFAALVLGLCLTATAAAAGDAVTTTPVDAKRRTLYVTVDNQSIRFEAPPGMCFADRTHRREGPFVEPIVQSLRQKGDEKLLGLFMPCDSLANPALAIAREGRVPSFGMILWPHDVGEAAPRDSSAAYLDWRAASFYEYVRVHLPAWLAAADPLRQPGDTARPPEIAPGPGQSTAGLFITYGQYLSADGRPFPTVGAVGTALLRGHPVEFVVRLNRASGISDDSGAHGFMVNFLDLQAAINR
jgi:hypothetical protein